MHAAGLPKASSNLGRSRTAARKTQEYETYSSATIYQLSCATVSTLVIIWGRSCSNDTESGPALIMPRNSFFMHRQTRVTLPLWFSCRNKVIWVGIFSQIGIALILSYGLGHVTALNFTPLRWVLMATYISCPSCINRHGLTILLTTDKWEQVAHALQFQEKYLRIFIMKNRVDNFLMKKDVIFIVPTKKETHCFFYWIYHRGYRNILVYNKHLKIFFQDPQSFGEIR